MPAYRPGTVVPSHQPPGKYPFVVREAKNKVSSSKNQMIELKIEIEGGVIFYDYLVFEPKSYWKIDQFRIATGDNLETNQDVDFDATDCHGRTGIANLTVEQKEGYKARNRVVEYLPEEKKDF